MLEKILTIILSIAVSVVVLAAPQLALDSPFVDFGEVVANAALVREVRVGSVGDAPLRVSRVKACCGAKGKHKGQSLLT